MNKTELLNFYNNSADDISPDAERVLLIDGLNTFFRNWSVNPSMNSNGDHMGGVSGFMRSIGYVIRQLRCNKCIIAWDGKGGSQRRRKLLPTYKGERKPNRRLNRTYEEMMTPEDELNSIRRQVVILQEFLKTLPIKVITIDNIEADDVIAYIATELYLDADNIFIMSTDKDFLQLVTERVHVWNPTKKTLYTPERMYEEFGIHSCNFLLYRMFEGDKSDKIDGIKGAGLTTLKKYIPILTEERKLTVDDIYNHCENADTHYKLFDTIAENRDIITRNFKLMQLGDVDISGINKLKIKTLSSAETPKLDKYAFIELLQKYQMADLFKNLHEWMRDTFLLLK